MARWRRREGRKGVRESVKESRLRVISKVYVKREKDGDNTEGEGNILTQPEPACNKSFIGLNKRTGVTRKGKGKQ